MPIQINGATSGSTTIQATDAVTQTITLPNNSGTVLTTASTFGGTGPAFSAYPSGAQSFASGVPTKVQLQTELFDTNNNFDSTTNYRFTPTIAGYYKVTGQIGFTVNALMGIQLFKNGSAVNSGQIVCTASAIFTNISALIYFNGSTDYVELYAYQSSGISANSYYGAPYSAYFEAFLARSA